MFTTLVLAAIALVVFVAWSYLHKKAKLAKAAGAVGGSRNPTQGADKQ